MSTAKIQPFQLRKPFSEVFLYVHQGALQHVSTTFTVAVTVEPFNVIWQLFRQFVARHAETCAGCTRVVKQCLHLAILRVHTQADARMSSHTVVKALIL